MVTNFGNNRYFLALSILFIIIQARWVLVGGCAYVYVCKSVRNEFTIEIYGFYAKIMYLFWHMLLMMQLHVIKVEDSEDRSQHQKASPFRTFHVLSVRHMMRMRIPIVRIIGAIFKNNWFH